MARLNEIWTPRHQDALRRVFNMRGTAPSPQLAPEIMPVILLHGSPIEDEPELGLLHGSVPFIARIQGAAVAAQFSFANLNLLPNSNFFAVIQWITANIAAFVQLIGGNQGGAAAFAQIQSRDSRVFNPPVAVASPVAALQGTQGSNAVIPATVHDLAALTPLRIQAILGPNQGGSAIAVWGNALNTAIVMSIIGYLRRPETSDGF